MRWLILLRSINVGGANRVQMGPLRAMLAAPSAAIGGHQLLDVRTYLQSGNIVVDWHGTESAQLVGGVQRLLAERLGVDAPVLVRRSDEVQLVVARNPFVEQAGSEPKLLQVTFTSVPLAPERLTELQALCDPHELLAAGDRVLYSWHPNGIARSKLGLALSKSSAQFVASSRNWRTVLQCEAMLSA